MYEYWFYNDNCFFIIVFVETTFREEEMLLSLHVTFEKICNRDGLFIGVFFYFDFFSYDSKK